MSLELRKKAVSAVTVSSLAPLIDSPVVSISMVSVVGSCYVSVPSEHKKQFETNRLRETIYLSYDNHEVGPRMLEREMIESGRYECVYDTFDVDDDDVLWDCLRIKIEPDYIADVDLEAKNALVFNSSGQGIALISWVEDN